MSAIINKFSHDGFEIGASKIGVIVLGKNNFYVREYLRYQFRRIQLGEIEQMDSTAIIFPKDIGKIDNWGNLIISTKG